MNGVLCANTVIQLKTHKLELYLANKNQFEI
jgi:hypothetical protein